MITGLRPGAFRSLLFVPASTRRKVHKALETNADVVILDLEDAVAPPAKEEARILACEVLRGDRSKRVVVRVNAADTAWHLADLATVAMAGPDAIMLPKCTGPADVERLCAQLSVLETAAGRRIGSIAILPLVTETAAALSTMRYAGVSARLAGLAFAGEDLAADLGVESRDGASMNPILTGARRQVAIAAAVAGVAAIDTPFPDPRDLDGLQGEAKEAARLGFAAKMCIHPDQIDAVNAAFQPSDARLDWARAVVETFAAGRDEGVTLLNGKMIDRAHLRLAERYLAQVMT